jgi:hypothetical protein
MIAPLLLTPIPLKIPRKFPRVISELFALNSYEPVLLSFTFKTKELRKIWVAAITRTI